MKTVLFIGDSFTRRTEDFLTARREGLRENLDLPEVSMSFHGVGGLKIGDLARRFVDVCEGFDFLVVNVGSNDLASRFQSFSPEELAAELVKWIHHILLHSSHVISVTIFNVLDRRPGRYFLPSDFSLRVDRFNRELVRLVRASPADGIFTCRVSGFSMNIEHFLSSDGVHLSTSRQHLAHSGQYKYCLALKAAIVRMLRFVSGGSN